MEKGFAVIYHDERMIKSKNELKPNDEIAITFVDGEVKAKILEV